MTDYKFLMRVPEEYQQAIGRVTVNYAFMESQMKALIVTLAEADNNVVLILTAGRRIVDLVDVVRSLYRYREQDEDLINEVDALMGRVDSLRIRRNDIMHSSWVTDMRDASTGLSKIVKIKATAKKGLKSEPKEVTNEELDELASDIMKVVNDIREADLQYQEVRAASLPPDRPDYSF